MENPNGGLKEQLKAALEARQHLFDQKHEAAFRLFNGFLEGNPDLIIDLYGRTLVIHNYANPFEAGSPLVTFAERFLLRVLPWLEAIVVKTRRSDDAEARNGIVIYGEKPNQSIREHGVRYAVDLLMNRDASFYLDTRPLRRWLLDHTAGQSVLNTFAYTGSLGVVAKAGGATRVVQTDLNKKFLNLAKTSYTLNGYPIEKRDFMTGDFFSIISRLKKETAAFDTVILDAPFFSKTQKGKVDLSNISRLINKTRPLVSDGGRLIAINNALYVSGEQYMADLEAICASGYVEIEQLIPVGEDFLGSQTSRIGEFVTDPTPFNHSTKIAVLRIFRKPS